MGRLVGGQVGGLVTFPVGPVPYGTSPMFCCLSEFVFHCHFGSSLLHSRSVVRCVLCILSSHVIQSEASHTCSQRTVVAQKQRRQLVATLNLDRALHWSVDDRLPQIFTKEIGLAWMDWLVAHCQGVWVAIGLCLASIDRICYFRFTQDEDRAHSLFSVDA